MDPSLNSGQALGLYYYNARFYLPGTGRFASADTIVPDPTGIVRAILEGVIAFRDGHSIFFGLPPRELIPLSLILEEFGKPNFIDFSSLIRENL